MSKSRKNYFQHESSCIDSPVKIGDGTKIWHFSHIMKNAQIGRECKIGQNVFIAEGVKVGNKVKIQNNVSIYGGIRLEDNVFCGPSCVFTNVKNPRSEIDRRGEYIETIVRRGATIGANATIVCGVEIGMYAFVAAGAVVTKNVGDYELVTGVPARRVGWMSRHGYKMEETKDRNILKCPKTRWKYEVTKNGVRCIDFPENKQLKDDD